jgi:hypothetical protein
MGILKDLFISFMVIFILILLSPFALIHKILMDDDKPNEQ